MTASPELVVVVGCDDRYAMALSVTLSSTLGHVDSTRVVRLMIVDGGMTTDSRRRIERVIRSASEKAEIVWHTADETRFAGLKVSKWGSTANYLRLLIPEIVGPDTTRVTYLDSDLLVRADISRLADLADGDTSPVAAVGDYHHRRCRTVFGEAGCARIGVDPDAPYFNSGVLVIDVDAWRRESIPSKAVEFVRRHADVMRHSDQDALNAILTHRWTPLEDRWNVMVPSIGRYLSHDIDPDATRATILHQGLVFHFTGARKPWIPGYMGPKVFDYHRELRDGSWFDGRSEWLRWSLGFWLRSPAGWAREGYRRLRRRAAIVYRSWRPLRP